MMPQLTLHAMLIGWGRFAQSLGLVKKIEVVQIRQKAVDYSPQTKVLEFLVANLAGLAHLKEISLAAHSPDKDHTVVHAWVQTSLVDYNEVSRTLGALSAPETEGIQIVLRQISVPLLIKRLS